MKTLLLVLLLQVTLTQLTTQLTAVQNRASVQLSASVQKQALAIEAPATVAGNISPPIARPPCPDCFVTQICGPFKWTRWIDRDDPSGYGDFETVVDAVPFGGCLNPVWIECQTLTGVNWWQTGDVIRFSTNGGCLCINTDQPLISGVRKCKNDYKIRQLCP